MSPTPNQHTVSIHLETAPRAYDIIVGPSLMDQAGALLEQHTGPRNCLIITDENVAPLYLQRLEKALGSVHHTVMPSITLPAGEPTKSFPNLMKLMDEVFKRKVDRDTLIIALGGGVMGDLTGFAASMILRGLDFIQVPTTLLSQVDSSVGGKTGINSSYGKNTVGAFYQPRMVLADTSTLDTLPKRQVLAGYAEVIKYGLIYDPDFFTWCNDNAQKLIDGDGEARSFAISTSCKIKAAIVEEDEREDGRRAILNLGHTFGHALENVTGYSDKLLHGEAVAIGTVMAFDLSVALGLCPAKDALNVHNHFEAIGLPTTPPKIEASIDQLMTLMTQDKKAKNGKITMILNDKIGSALIKKDVDPEPIKEIWKSYL